MTRHPDFFKKTNTRRRVACPGCGKTFVRSEDRKGWRDHCKHVSTCVGRKK